jgi:TatD DNase family protein
MTVVSMQFVDTHCHIQEAGQSSGTDDLVQNKWHKAGINSPDELIDAAVTDGVKKMICVGCSLSDSRRAVELALRRKECWASIGIHPHEAKSHMSDNTLRQFATLAGNPRVIAVGECGLDYYYNHSPKSDQITILEYQLQLATDNNLPLIFHVRDAFEDFWSVLDNFSGIRGVVHSFSAGKREAEQIISRNLLIGLNGIMTFTKDQSQLDTAKFIPLSSLLLETDAPFLTPVPFRGTICQPKHVGLTANFLSKLRDESLEELAHATTDNATNLFNL